MGGFTYAELVNAFREAINGMAVRMDGVAVGEVQASAKQRKAAFA
jgi:hypothetical protein